MTEKKRWDKWKGWKKLGGWWMYIHKPSNPKFTLSVIKYENNYKCKKYITLRLPSTRQSRFPKDKLKNWNKNKQQNVNVNSTLMWTTRDDKLPLPFEVTTFHYNSLLGAITMKWANNDKRFKDCSPFCGHFDFLI